MRWSSFLCVAVAMSALAVWTAIAGAAPVQRTSGASGQFVLVTTSPGKGYSPTFTGNGRLGVRVPATGQGYAGGSGLRRTATLPSSTTRC